MPWIVLIAHCCTGDLFDVSLSLTRPAAGSASTVTSEAGQPSIVKRLETGRAEATVPRVSVRRLPVHLLSEPAVMTLAAQQSVCADCLGPTGPAPRFCSLFGRWFCGDCHRDDESLLPSRVLRLWDLKKYRVCRFAREEIARSAKTVLYDVQEVNPGLFRVSENLLRARNLRRQLVLLVTFVAECPVAPAHLRCVVGGVFG